MAGLVNTNIVIDIQTAKAQAELKALQAQITALNASMLSQQKAKGFNLGMGDLNKEIISVRSNVQALNKELVNGSRKFGASAKSFGNAYRKRGAEMELARQNAAALGTQYEVLGKQANGMLAVMKGGQLANFNMQLATSASRVAIMSQSLTQMGTAALNWGKNMQWAGRQLMVGLTIPFTIFAAVSVKAFQDVERELVNLRKVYGDFGTTSEELEKVTE